MDIRTVKEGVKLKCSFGIEKSILKVPKDRGAYIQSGNQATIKDSIVNENIFTFKYCKRIKRQSEVIKEIKDPETGMIVPVKKCEPKVILDWINGKEDLTLKGELALLNICIVPCVYGGIISIDENAGQTNKLNKG